MYIYVMVMQQRDWCYPGESCLEIRLQITAVLKNVCDIKTPTLSCKYLYSCGKMTVVVLKTCSQTLIPHPSWDEAQYFSLPVWAWPSYLTYRVWQPQMRLLRCEDVAFILDHSLGKPATKSWAARQRHPCAKEGGLHPQHCERSFIQGLQVGLGGSFRHRCLV